MKYILDASVALKWVLSEADSPIANRLRDEFKQQSHELLAPDTLPVEVAHALTRAERKGLIQGPSDGTAPMSQFGRASRINATPLSVT